MLLTSGREAPAPAAAAQDTKALKEIKNFNEDSNIVQGVSNRMILNNKNGSWETKSRTGDVSITAAENSTVFATFTLAVKQY